MPSKRKPNTKLAGAYIDAEKDKALGELALKLGFENKADYLRSLFDDALNSDVLREEPPTKWGAKKK